MEIKVKVPLPLRPDKEIVETVKVWQHPPKIGDYVGDGEYITAVRKANISADQPEDISNFVVYEIFLRAPHKRTAWDYVAAQITHAE